MVGFVSICEQSSVVSTVNTDSPQWPCWHLTVCAVPYEINLFCFIRTSAWDGTQMSTESRWRGWWGRNWSAGSRTMWCHRSATRSQPLLSARGHVHLRPCPLMASTQSQMGAAMCDGFGQEKSNPLSTAITKKKKNSIGNVRGTNTRRHGTIFQNKIRSRRWTNQSNFPSNMLMHWKWLRLHKKAFTKL